MQTSQTKRMKPRKAGESAVRKELSKNYELYLMFLPVFVFFLIFAYKPMYGILMAFQNYSPSKGVLGSPWVGFLHFKTFFNSFYFGRLLKNTLMISLCSIVFGFPAPILLALLMNEIKNKTFKKTVQTISYLPHFISLVVICSMIKKFTLSGGIINDIIVLFGGTRSNLLNSPSAFVPIYILSDIWTEIGWGSIIYLAALSGISMELYEAAAIEGAGRFKQAIHVTIPGIAPTIVIMFILRMGSVLSVGYEKIILLYNPMTKSVADVISSYVYEKGILNQSWSFSTAVGLFNAVINLIFLVLTNQFSKKVSDTALW